MNKIFCFVEYTVVKYFNKFVQSAANARLHGHENPNSSVVAETRKLLTNNSFGYQNMNRTHHSVTRYMNDEETHVAINKENFTKLRDKHDLTLRGRVD